MRLRELAKTGVLWYSSILHNNRGSKILYYHDIYRSTNYKALDSDLYMGTHLDLFKKHVEIIRNEGYNIVSNIDNSHNQVAIMLDDGFRGIWECREYFFEEEIYPTIFLPVEFIGDKEKGMLSREEILELQKHGFRFECHGWSHRPLTEVREHELEHELHDSKLFLSDFLSKDVDEICLPLGYYSQNLIKKIKEYGYKKIYSSIPGNITDNRSGMLTRNLCQFASPTEVKFILRGGNVLLESRYQKLHEKS